MADNGPLLEIRTKTCVHVKGGNIQKHTLVFLYGTLKQGHVNNIQLTQSPGILLPYSFFARFMAKEEQ
jgi:hypothetical protein